MRVRHVASQAGASLASVAGDKFYYRTEVTNTNAVPIKIVWFDGFFLHDDQWHANNITTGVMREENFLAWYGDGDAFEGGWLAPGKTAPSASVTCAGHPRCCRTRSWRRLPGDPQ